MELEIMITDFIKNEVRKNNNHSMFREPLVGFSSAADPLYGQLKKVVGEYHFLPADILPEAKSVISYFIPFEKVIVDSNRKKAETSEEWALAYIACNKLINSISERLAAFLSELGIKAEMIRATHTYDDKTLESAWSHKSAAYIAGLGRFGLNRMLITPKGCAGRFGSVIISEQLEYGKPLDIEYCGFFKDGKCMYCTSNCPVNALTETSIDKHRCNEHLLKVNGSFPELEKCDVCGKCAVGACAIWN